MSSLSENPDLLAHPQRVADLLLYRMSVITRSMSLPMVRIFEGEFGITRRHWHILAMLVERGALTASELAVLCRLDRPRISRAVSGLRQKQLIARTGGSARLQSLTATEAGHALYAQAMQRVCALNADLARTMTDEERVVFDRVLRRLQDSVAKLAEDAAATAPPSARHRGRG